MPDLGAMTVEEACFELAQSYFNKPTRYWPQFAHVVEELNNLIRDEDYVCRNEDGSLTKQGLEDLGAIIRFFGLS